MIEPDSRTIWDCRPDLEPVALRGAGVVDLGRVIPGFSFSVEELFRLLRPRRRR
jgi:hypothetical protein